MGILTEIFSSLAIGAIKAAIAGGGALARIGARAVAEARPRIAAAVQAVRQQYRLARAKRAVRTGSRDVIHAELGAINDLLAELGDKARRSGGLSAKERSKKEELVHQRQQLLSALQSVDEQRIAEKIVDELSEYDALTISNDTSHLLQSTVGQTLYGKPCPKCGWQMQLQWDRNKSTIGTDDFGWGCTGWYWKGKGVPHKCAYWEPLAPEDYDIFAQAKRPEYSELSAKQFSALVLGHGNNVVKRMDDVRHDSSLRGSVDAYRCPVHGEPLVLQQKREHSGRLLDMYFLGCPRWKGRDEGCQFMVKLKSPAQLHAYLEAATGDGVI